MKKLSIHYLLLLFFTLQSSLFTFAAKQKAVEDKANEVKEDAKEKAGEAVDAAADKVKKGLGI